MIGTTITTIIVVSDSSGRLIAVIISMIIAIYVHIYMVSKEVLQQHVTIIIIIYKKHTNIQTSFYITYDCYMQLNYSILLVCDI